MGPGGAAKRGRACRLYTSDVDSLLTPPILAELQTEVDEALRDVVGQELRLCYPAGGRYRCV